MRSRRRWTKAEEWVIINEIQAFALPFYIRNAQFSFIIPGTKLTDYIQAIAITAKFNAGNKMSLQTDASSANLQQSYLDRRLTVKRQKTVSSGIP